MKSLKKPWFNLIALAICAVILTACFKQNTMPTESDSSLEQLCNDEITVDAADDDMWDDMNSFLDDGGYKSSQSLPCNVKDSVTVKGDTIIHTLIYNGTNCTSTRFRSGQVIMKHSSTQKWSEQGARVIVNMKNYKTSRLSYSKSIILNGNKTYENISGGRLSEVTTGSNLLVQRGTGKFTVTFDNTSQTWEMARQRIFSGPNGNRQAITSGFGSVTGYKYIVFWGSNRTGTPFLSQIISDMYHQETCSGLPITGKKMLMLGGEKNNVVTYGYNDKDQPISGTECPTKLKLEWQTMSLKGIIYVKL